MKNRNFNTKAIHVGNDPDKENGAVTPPIHFSSTFKQDEVVFTKAMTIRGQATLQEKDLKKIYPL